MIFAYVQAVVSEEKKATNNDVPGANLQIFPPNNAGSGGQGYQPIGSTSDGGGQPATNNWTGVFSISSYTQFFNVDTDIVLNRLISSLYPTTGDFVNKIDANPDLYGLVWISTTLVFAIASLGNCATYLMQRRSDHSTLWTFDVNYLNVAAGAIYGYALIVPLGYYFVLQYLGSSVSLIRFWCLWGYSLFIFILTSVSSGLNIAIYLLIVEFEFTREILFQLCGWLSYKCGPMSTDMHFACLIFGYAFRFPESSLYFFSFCNVISHNCFSWRIQFLLVIPVEFLRWTIILIAGAASASFVGLNLRSYIQSNDLTIVAISAFVLQMGLSIFIKMWFFA
ncbi:UNVERIFIED_CONTAM: hypothetical protein Slati_1259800 [Sesamum latifolium]|uniref:Protein YIP n=1 Tax=Sesamum latifolium TaxID=2727402 RepID=A0AAW2XF58_9LAMI